MSIKESIAKNLLYYRKKSGLTQKQFAEMLGVKNTAVSNWENGQNSIDIETLCKACDIFGVTLNDMYEKESNVFTLSEKEKAVILAYRARPDMQNAVNTLLGIQPNSSIATDATSVIAEAEKVFNIPHTELK